MDKTRPLPGRPAAWPPRFLASDSGAMSIFMIYIMVIILLVGGMAVDIVRYESARARLQSMLDRATLAAADLEQTLDPVSVVYDFAEKEGLDHLLTNVEVVENFNARTVTAEADMSMGTYFMSMVGIESLGAPAASAATEEILDIEVAMVLDVSGSMQGAKISNLQDAAIDFVDILMADDEDNRISIALVPFNGQVNLGPSLRSEYNVTDIPYRTNVACVDLPSSVYSAQTISRTLALPSTGYVDTYSSTNRSSYYTSPYYYGPNSANVWCPDSSDNHVRLPTTNQGDLNRAINNLSAVGATSINAGMRWGMTLLDPSFGPIMQHQIALGHVPGNLAGRPFGYRTPNTMKVIVLMTDGEHFAEERLNAGYRSGASTIYRGSDGNYSMYYDRSNTSNDYWVPHRSEWRSQAWPTNSQASRMDWRDVWNTMRVSYVAWEFYGRGLGGSSSNNRNYYYEYFYDQMRTRTAIGDMNNQLQQLCNRARDERVIVFGVSFDAPAAGREQIFNCAFTPSHFYNAAVDDIGDVFEAIANQIKSLRLIQ